MTTPKRHTPNSARTNGTRKAQPPERIYYTLQQAADTLNAFFETSHIDREYLLHLGATYRVQLAVRYLGDDATCVFRGLDDSKSVLDTQPVMWGDFLQVFADVAERMEVMVLTNTLTFVDCLKYVPWLGLDQYVSARKLVIDSRKIRGLPEPGQGMEIRDANGDFLQIAINRENLVVFHTELERIKRGEPSGLVQAPAPAPKPLDAREANSMGKVVAALASLAKLDISQPHKAAGVLNEHAAAAGLEMPSNQTTAKYLGMGNQEP